MAASLATMSTAPCATRQAFRTGAQRAPLARIPGLVQQRTALSSARPVEGRPAVSCTPLQRPVRTQVATEVFQLAEEGGFIAGTAATMFAITLIGLAIGFVLLRVEALVEEGKL